MYRASITILVLSAAVASATSTAGQSVDDRSGFWIAGAVSGSSMDINCEAFCPADRQLGISGFVQLGGTPSARTLAGIEAYGWRSSDSEAAREYIAVLGIGHYYPAEDIPLHVKLGLGAGRYGEEAGADQISATGFALQLGVGYEFALTQTIWAGPFITYLTAPGMNAKRNRFGLSTDFRINALQLGGRVAWH